MGAHKGTSTGDTWFGGGDSGEERFVAVEKDGRTQEMRGANNCETEQNESEKRWRD